MTMVQAVIFDMDGVLCASDHLMVEAAQRMFRERHGTTVAAEDFVPFYGAGEDRFLGGVADKYQVQLDMPADKERAYELYLAIVRGRIQPLPGCRTFINDCRARGLKLAVASSADRVKVDGNLRELGLADGVFDVVVSGSEIARKKPDPEIFATTASLLGIPPAACLVVEDAPNGIRAAKAAGCGCLGLTTSFTSTELVAAGADWIASDLATVPSGVLT